MYNNYIYSIIYVGPTRSTPCGSRAARVAVFVLPGGAESPKSKFDLAVFNSNDDDESSKSIISLPTDSDKVTSNNIFPYGKLNVLLVDDSSSILKMVGSILRKRSHTVVEAANGANALKKIETVRSTPGMQPFDVVVIDLQMPVMDGKYTKILIEFSYFLIILISIPMLLITQVSSSPKDFEKLKQVFKIWIHH